MNLWFGGGEVSTHRSLLAQEGVDTVAVNLSAYFKQRQAPRMSQAYDGYRIVLYSSEGGLDPNKVRTFVEANADKCELIYGLPSDAPQFVPEWSGGELATFYSLATQHPVVGLSDAVALDPRLMAPIVAFARREGVKLLTAASKAAALAAAPWSHVIMSAWLSASKHRELQVWDGRIVKRYPRARRLLALETHDSQIERLGVSVEDLRNDDPDACMRLAVRSWQLWAAGDNVVPLTLVAGVLDDAEGGVGTDLDLAVAGEVARLRTPVAIRERSAIPVMHLVSVAPDGDATVLQVASKQLRTCDSCFLAQHCPGFRPHHECAYEIPVRITTKAELQAVINAMLEMQVQRIFMERMAEDLLSQGLNQVVSEELKNFFMMLKIVKEINDNREQITITARAESGRLSALFGSRVGEVNRQLASPVPSGEVLHEILDGTVLADTDD